MKLYKIKDLETKLYYNKNYDLVKKGSSWKVTPNEFFKNIKHGQPEIVEINYIEENILEDSYCVTTSTSKWILPRLKMLKEKSLKHLQREDDFYGKLDSIILAFTLLNREEGNWDFNKEEENQIDEGLINFKEIIYRLWW